MYNINVIDEHLQSLFFLKLMLKHIHCTMYVLVQNRKVTIKQDKMLSCLQNKKNNSIWKFRINVFRIGSAIFSEAVIIFLYSTTILKC